MLRSLRKESMLAALIAVTFVVYAHFNIPRHVDRTHTNEFAWDILSYQLYLPLNFIEADGRVNDSAYIRQIFDRYQFSPAFYQAAPAPNGNMVMIYTMGMAYLYSPFFFIGHAWAQNSGYPADGFSYPYQYAIASGMLIYIIIGIFFLRKVLLHFFSERISALVILILLMGTNLLREIIDYDLGPHAVMFSVYCVLIWYTIRWHQQQKKRYVIAIGLSIGLLTLIRPTDAICIFIPLLWNIHDSASFRQKWLLVRSHLPQLMLLVLVVFLVGLPQLLYWYKQTGSFFYNSYRNQNSFDITDSYFMKVFFSIRKGWLVYTPLIALALTGLFLLRTDRQKEARTATWVFIILNIFILTHVPVWFNAGSFGQRFMVQSYALLSIPLGACIQYISEQRLLIRTGMTVITAMLICLNLFQIWQFVHWIIPGDGMTWKYYKYSFFKTSPMTTEEQKMLELQRSYDPNETFQETNPNYGKRFLVYYSMDSLDEQALKSPWISDAHALSGLYSNVIDSSNPYSVGFNLPFNAITPLDHCWIKYTAWFYSEKPIGEKKVNLAICTIHDDVPYHYVTYPLDDVHYKTGRWNKITGYYLTPLLQDKDDEISACIWHDGKEEVFLDNILIEAFVPKRN